jgi:adenylate cyclase
MPAAQRDRSSGDTGKGAAAGLSGVAAAARRLGPRLRRGLLGRVPLLVLFAGIGLHLAMPDLLDRVTLMCFDLYQRAQPRPPSNAPIRIVDIDNKSIREIGQWPWPRSVIAELVDRLREAGAAAVVFDIFFSEPDRTAPQMLTVSLQHDKLDPDTMREVTRLLSELPDPDSKLAEAMRKVPSVTAFVLADGEATEAPATKAGFGFVSGGDDNPLRHVPDFKHAISTLPQLTAAALGNGFVNPSIDRDGIAREVPFVLRYDGKPFASLAAEALRVAQGAHAYIVRRSPNGELQIRVGDLTVPTDSAGRVWLHFARPNPDIYDSCAKILSDGFDPKSPAVRQRFEGHIVLIGTSAKGIVADSVPTPIDRHMLGMELQAQTMEQAIEGGFLTRPLWGDGAGTLYALVQGVLLTLLLPRFGALLGAGLAVVGVGAALAASWLAFSHSDLLIDPVYPVVMLVLVYVVATLLGYLRTEARHREIRSTFSRYMSPRYVEELVRHPERLGDLGGELRMMTIMFCDIRGYTSLSEGIDAHALTQLTNSFLSPMTDIITEHKGTIDKYIGDCIMSFWNAPLDDPEHAQNAVRAAQAMRRKLVELNRGWKVEAEAAGRPYRPINIGIGVNSGECVVGNFGSTQRMEYSLRGDPVNLASRLEGLGKLYGVDLVIGEATADLCTEAALVELDLVAVKGRSQAVHVYTLEPEPSEQAAFVDSHTALLTAYRHRDWAAALDLLDSGVLAAARHLAPVYDLYRRRIADFQVRTPPPDWNGVFAAEEK